MEIRQIDHCDLCEYQTHSSEGGYICKVTGYRANFDDKCSISKFDQKLETELKLSYLHVLDLKKQKVWNLIQSTLAFVVALSVIGYGVYMLLKLREMGYISTYPFIITAVGLGVLLYSVATYLNFSKAYSGVRSRFKKVETIASLYNIKYILSKNPAAKGYHGIEANDAMIEYLN